MLPTPSTSHLTSPTIYPPSEDSYLLLDTLSSAPQTHFLSSRFPPPTLSPLILEVGVGSGVVIAFLAANASSILGRDDFLALGCDVNLDACHEAGKTVIQACEDQGTAATARQWLGVTCTDLATSMKRGCIDVLIFNPPYVPTECLPSHPETGMGEEGTMLELAWAGGEEGMEVTSRLLKDLDRLLSANGVAYVLLCRGNRPEQLSERLSKEGWEVDVAGSSGKKAGWEKLVVLRICRP
ncbi:MAG: hypothetical protein Q9160_006463 [Pyrenula sp. 1 TL-2023]